MRSLVILGLSLAACGGSSRPAATTPSAGADESAADDDEGGDNLVPPERMDEIKIALDRKRNAAARCLADAVNSGAADRNARGHVSLGFTIGTDGRAGQITVIESSLDNPTVEQCVVGKVGDIEFGPLPRALEWSYVFAFESM